MSTPNPVQDPALPKFEVPLNDKGGVTSKYWYFFFQGLLNSIGSGVTKIIAGTNVTISPTSGIGNVTINATGGGGGSGTVTSVGAGTGITVAPSPIVGAGTVAITNTAVTPGSYTNTNLTVNAQGQLTAAASGAGGAANITPDTHPSSPTVFDDEFEFGSSIDLTGARRAGALPWAWTNQLTSTALVTQGSLVLTPASSGGRNCGILTQSLSGVVSPWAFTCKFQADNLASAAQAGMVLSGAGGFIVFGIAGVNNTSVRWNVQNLTNPTTLSSNVVTTPSEVNVWNFTAGASLESIYLQITFTAGTTLSFLASVSGVPGSFVFLGTVALSAFLTTLTGVGVYGDAEGTGVNNRGVYDWFRRTA